MYTKRALYVTSTTDALWARFGAHISHGPCFNKLCTKGANWLRYNS